MTIDRSDREEAKVFGGKVGDRDVLERLIA